MIYIHISIKILFDIPNPNLKATIRSSNIPILYPIDIDPISRELLHQYFLLFYNTHFYARLGKRTSAKKPYADRVYRIG